MRQIESQRILEFSGILTRIVAVGLICLLSQYVDTTPVKAVTNSEDAPMELASFVGSLEHNSYGSRSLCTIFKVSDRVLLSSDHCPDDQQDFILNPQKTVIRFPTAPEIGAIPVIKIIRVESARDLFAYIIDPLPTTANVTSIELGTEEDISADQNALYYINGLGKHNTTEFWPQLGVLSPTEECPSVRGRIFMKSAEGAHTQPQHADSGAPLLRKRINENGTITPVAVGMLEGYCKKEKVEEGFVINTPSAFSIITTQATRDELQQIIHMANSDSFTQPPETETYLTVNGERVAWEGRTFENATISEDVVYNRALHHQDFTGQSIVTITEDDIIVESAPSCLQFNLTPSSTDGPLTEGFNTLHSFSILNSCDELQPPMAPYENLNASVRSISMATKTFAGEHGTEVITDVQETRHFFNFYNSVNINLNSLSTEPFVLFEDEKAQITVIRKGTHLEFTIIATNRPLKIGYKLTDLDASDASFDQIPLQILEVPWTFEERGNQGPELAKTVRVEIDDILPKDSLLTFVPYLISNQTSKE